MITKEGAKEVRANQKLGTNKDLNIERLDCRKFQKGIILQDFSIELMMCILAVHHSTYSFPTNFATIYIMSHQIVQNHISFAPLQAVLQLFSTQKILMHF